MSSREPAPLSAAAPTPPAVREPRWALTRWVGWALLACYAALLVTGVVAGERPASYDDLRFAVARGDVDEVTVTGGVAGSYRGSATVEVHWRDGVAGRVAEVVEVHPAPRNPTTSTGTPRVRSVEEDLASIDRRVQVTRQQGEGGWAEVRGWRLPGWAGLLTAFVWLATFLLVVAGPPPWRANRWAWFWGLALAAPVGIPAYLLLGGPTGLARPVVGGSRVRGGWGFVLALVAGAAFGAVGTSLGF